MPARKVLVIGAGVGGLVSALELAAHGLDVTVLDRAAGPGGKLREVDIGGAAIDAGPTVFTMRWVFDEIFQAAGETLDSHISLKPADILARHHWNAGETLDLFADIDHSADAIGAFAGAKEAQGYRRFCARGRQVYQALDAAFLRSQRPTPLSLTRAADPVGLWRGAPFSTLWQQLGRHFRDPRLRQLFGRYATYCGSSPFAAPAILMLIAHVEQRGVWLVEGGMHRLAQALAGLAERRGVALRYCAEIADIAVKDGRVEGVGIRRNAVRGHRRRQCRCGRARARVSGSGGPRRRSRHPAARTLAVGGHLGDGCADRRLPAGPAQCLLQR